MSGFGADWLALREPFDAAARSGGLAAGLAARAGAAQPLAIVDLGCGTGANLRYLAPRLGGRQRWTLVDHDPRLLAELAPRLREWAARAGGSFRPQGGAMHVAAAGFEAAVRPLERDLAHDLERLVAGDVHLVTAAALLDLVSEGWLARLVGACRSAGAAVLFALTYDGRVAWSPADADDARVRDAVNRHQRTDKGFGAALGPDAAGHAARLLRAAGYEVDGARSDWHVGSDARAMQAALLEGWREAASAIAPDGRAAFAAWAARRAAAIERGVSVLHVGHVDLAGRPA